MIIPTRLTCAIWPNYPGVSLKKPAVVCWSFAEDGKEMYQSLWRTCRATVLLIKTIVYEVLIGVVVDVTA